MPTIRELRIGRKWSQQHLADLAGVSSQTISKMERGRPVQRTSILLVAQTLEVDPSEVTGVNIVNLLKS